MIQIGDIITDNYELMGIVLEREGKPTDEWLELQNDERMRQQPEDVKWWSVLPFTGGAVCIPEPLMVKERRATIDDLQEVYRNGYPFAQEELEQMYQAIIKGE